MDASSFTFIESLLSYVGLTIQDAIWQLWPDVLRWVALSIVVLSLASIFFYAVKSRNLDDFLKNMFIYVFTVAVIWGCISWKVPMSIKMRSPEALSSPRIFQTVIDDAQNGDGQQVEVSALFAALVWPVDMLTYKLAETINKAAGGPGAGVRVDATVSSAAMSIISHRLPTGHPVRTKLAELKNPDTGCLALLTQAAMIVGPGSKTGNHSARTAWARVFAYVSDEPESQIYLNDYNRYLDALAKTPQGQVQAQKINECKALPGDIRHEFDKAVTAHASLASWQYGNNGKLISTWKRAQLVPSLASASSKSGVWGWLKGVVADAVTSVKTTWDGAMNPIKGEVALSLLPFWMGLADALLYAFFPLFLIAALIPGKLKALAADYFKMILWIKSWIVFAAFFSAVDRIVTMSNLEKLNSSGWGLDLRMDAISSAMGHALAIVPVIAYFVVFGLKNPSALMGGEYFSSGGAIGLIAKGGKAIASGGRSLAGK